MPRRYLLALDQGTTGTTCLLFDLDLRVVGRAYQEVRCAFPQPGWVSQDPEELWASSQVAMRGALRHAGVEASEVAALGLTNQRETTILWDRANGRPIHDAVVWQCRRSAGIVREWTGRGLTERIQKSTGLVPMPTSRLQIRWNPGSGSGPRNGPDAESWPSARWTAGSSGS